MVNNFMLHCGTLTVILSTIITICISNAINIPLSYATTNSEQIYKNMTEVWIH
jgi:hypothetical protein